MLLLVRHTESAWNQQNLFTGWVDIPLSLRGVEEALALGKRLKTLPVDKIFSSRLIRAQMTAALMLVHHQSGKTPFFLHEDRGGEWEVSYTEEQKKGLVPVFCNAALNERMYGELQGKNKAEMMQQYGKEQVQRWRRGFAEVPPGGESLAMTIERAVPYFQKEISPCLERGENVWVVAHGNSLRGIVMALEHLSPEEVLHFEIATGEVLSYCLEKEGWKRSSV
ncbi:MAG: histidine phosphatase family protein [Verrucomicrobiota bacterium]|nr:histidine phosphatase family protein [Verrucomicrobiota bacterium]